MKQKVIVIVGPTASGKSALAVDLARLVDGEVISADSRQVYEGLDIGTGKITKREMKGIRHHLLDVASPKQTVTGDSFARQARIAIEDIAARGKVPIVAGGTGFYIDILLGRIAPAPVAADRKLRKKLGEKTDAQLLSLLKRRNAQRAADIIAKNEVSNRHRLIRAIEVTYGEKAPVPINPKYDALWIGIQPERAALRKKIRDRLVERLKKGMIREAERLHESGLSWKRMDELGLEYRYLAFYLQKKISKEELIAQLSAKIWQYARRQMTYWRRNKDIHWFAPEQAAKQKAAIVRGFLR